MVLESSSWISSKAETTNPPITLITIYTHTDYKFHSTTANSASMAAISKVFFILALASMVMMSGPVLKVGGSERLLNCWSDADCLTICQDYKCEFCQCLSGICVNGCPVG